MQEVILISILFSVDTSQCTPKGGVNLRGKCLHFRSTLCKPTKLADGVLGDHTCKIKPHALAENMHILSKP